MTDFQARVLRLWDRGLDTYQITLDLRKTERSGRAGYPLHESQVYRALNAARVERRVYAECEAS